MVVNGLAAATVAVNHTGTDDGTITGAEPVTVTYDTIESLTVWAATSTELAASRQLEGLVQRIPVGSSLFQVRAKILGEDQEVGKCDITVPVECTQVD